MQALSYPELSKSQRIGQLTAVQSDQPRRTKCDHRLDTKNEPAARHEELSVGHVIPTRDGGIVMVLIPTEELIDCTVQIRSH